MDLPYRCFRGILTKEWVLPDGGVDKQTFRFKLTPGNPDYEEASIYWDDDDNTVEFARKQKKEGTDSPAHEGGLAEILTGDLKRMKKLPVYNKWFDFVRAKSETDPLNIYHGNLLLGPCTPTQIKKRAVNHLADLVQRVL